jgi:hypothetical protein
LAAWFPGVAFRPRFAGSVRLELPDRLEFQRSVVVHGMTQQLMQRGRILLAAVDDDQDKEIAKDLQINFKILAPRRGRFRKEGSDCL